VVKVPPLGRLAHAVQGLDDLRREHVGALQVPQRSSPSSKPTIPSMPLAVRNEVADRFSLNAYILQHVIRPRIDLLTLGSHLKSMHKGGCCSNKNAAKLASVIGCSPI
jgi:hypothetical protein